MSHPFPMALSKPTPGGVSRTTQQSHQNSGGSVTSLVNTNMNVSQASQHLQQQTNNAILSSKPTTTTFQASIVKVLPSNQRTSQQHQSDSNGGVNKVNCTLATSPKTQAGALTSSQLPSQQQRHSPSSSGNNHQASALNQYGSRPSSNNKRRSLKPVVLQQNTASSVQKTQNQNTQAIMNSSGYLIQQQQSIIKQQNVVVETFNPNQRNVLNKMNSSASNNTTITHQQNSPSAITESHAYMAAYTDQYQAGGSSGNGNAASNATVQTNNTHNNTVNTLTASLRCQQQVYINSSASKTNGLSAKSNGLENQEQQSIPVQEIATCQKVRRNADYKISRTSERIITTAKTNKRSQQTANNKNAAQQVVATGQNSNSLNKEAGQSDTMNSIGLDGTEQFSMTTARADDMILDFVDPTKNLNGRIGVYKINFNKNLRRFQDIAADQAQKEPQIAEVVNRFLQETLLPSVWGFSHLGQSSKFLKHIQQNSLKVDSINSPERADIGQGAMYNLNSTALPLQVNFNPLMITFCLFLRSLVDISKTITQSTRADSNSVGDRVAEFCLVNRKKIVSKLYQIQIKAINHALQNLNIEGVSHEQHPAKVIEFIKKWVAKEKVLIAHCVKALIPPDFDQVSVSYQQNTTQSSNTIKIEESSVYLTKDLAAKKNRQQYASRVNNSKKIHNGGDSNLNTSKESDDSADKKYHPLASMEIGGMTQDNFYKIPAESASPWKPGDHSMSHPSNIMAINEWSDQQPIKSLQQKVNNRHRENQHRNLFVEYHQVGSNGPQKQTIFREPQMALSSSNFNKNHQNSLMQIKIQQQQNLQQPSGGIQKTTSGRQGHISEVYGDRKQNQTNLQQRNSNNGPPGSNNPDMVTNEHLRQDSSYRANMNRSYSPTQLFQPVSNTTHGGGDGSEECDDNNEDLINRHQQSSSSCTLLPIQHQQNSTTQSNRTAISGAQTVTAGFYNMQTNQSQPVVVNSNHMRNFQNKSELGYQNLQNFQWPNKPGQSSGGAGAGERMGSRGQRPQTRDSYFSPAQATNINGPNQQYSNNNAGTGSQRQGQRGQQALATLNNNGGANNSGQLMMRSTAGPATFNVSRGQQQQVPPGMHHQAQMIERPSTRHGSDERNLQRPITQGMSRRAAGLGQINSIMNGPTPGTAIQKHPNLSRQKVDKQQSLKNNQPIDKTYINQGPPDVISRRTSSRGMNRIYGGGSASLNKMDGNRVQVKSRQTEKEGQGSQEGLETIKNQPAGFDPIFNQNSNSAFVNENSCIKIKPMGLSKGFESGEMNRASESNFEATDTSSFSALSRGTSICAQDNTNLTTSHTELAFKAEENKLIVQQKPQTSPSMYNKEQKNQNSKKSVADKIERKRNSKGKVIAAHSQSSHFRKNITSKNNRETAMESILEEDENLVKEPHNQRALADDNNLELKSQLRVKKKTSVQRKDGSNGSTTMSTNFTQVKNENGELSTMQTSGGFSNPRRSPRDPSFENSQSMRQGAAADSQLRLRPQLLTSQNNYNSLNQLKLIDKESSGSATSISVFNNRQQVIPGANQTSSHGGFNNIIEEEEFAYQDDKKQMSTVLPTDIGNSDLRKKRKLALMHQMSDKVTENTGHEPHLKNRISSLAGVSSPGANSTKNSNKNNNVILRCKPT